ncbi:MAG: STAS domain-containing protein [Gemmatimonadetes bacterium]|nr:STAS domain-containing protein [Gemmatimonadota bacterium]
MKVLHDGSANGIVLPLVRGMTDVIVQAPPYLGAQTRAAFHAEALEQLDSLSSEPEGGGRLVIDLSKTSGMDSMGLSTLVLLQLRAAERRRTVCLRGASEEVRFLLVMTGLEDRFDIEARP